jgi:hypothetical protein
VVQRGINKYLVIYANEADRRALTKEGWEEDITAFDYLYNLTECPASWSSKQITKPMRRSNG